MPRAPAFSTSVLFLRIFRSRFGSSKSLLSSPLLCLPSLTSRVTGCPSAPITVTILVSGEPMNSFVASASADVAFLNPYSPASCGCTAMGMSNMTFSADDMLAPIVQPKPTEVAICDHRAIDGDWANDAILSSFSAMGAVSSLSRYLPSTSLLRKTCISAPYFNWISCFSMPRKLSRKPVAGSTFTPGIPDGVTSPSAPKIPRLPSLRSLRLRNDCINERSGIASSDRSIILSIEA